MRAASAVKGSFCLSHGPGSALSMRTGPENDLPSPASFTSTERRVRGPSACFERSNSRARNSSTRIGNAPKGSITARPVAYCPETSPSRFASIDLSVPLAMTFAS